MFNEKVATTWWQWKKQWKKLTPIISVNLIILPKCCLYVIFVHIKYKNVQM